MAIYEEWVMAYHKYLTDLYERIFVSYLSRKEKREMTFDKFCRFVYANSSGDIVNYL